MFRAELKMSQGLTLLENKLTGGMSQRNLYHHDLLQGVPNQSPAAYEREPTNALITTVV